MDQFAFNQRVIERFRAQHGKGPITDQLDAGGLLTSERPLPAASVQKMTAPVVKAQAASRPAPRRCTG
ncbi:hypothetical protein ACQB60_45065 [Actinomycetota bacterium Odt1-20B]